MITYQVDKIALLISIHEIPVIIINMILEVSYKNNLCSLGRSASVHPLNSVIESMIYY